MKIRHNVSLAKSTGILFVTLVLAIQLITLGITSRLIFYPIAQHAVSDLAALIVLSAKTWGELPSSRLSDFKAELKQHQALDVEIYTSPLPGNPSYLPYVVLLQSALEERLKKPVSIIAIPGTDRYRVVVPSRELQLSFEFSRDRIGTRPLLAMGLIFGINLVASITAALWLARRLKRHLSALSSATRELAQGLRPQILPEDGPTELATVAQDFNQMASQVRELMDNRTTLLAGISHDLRTPIARMTMAMELLRTNSDPELFERMDRYLIEMNQLINEFISFTKSQDSGSAEPFDLCHAVDLLVQEYQNGGAQLKWEATENCLINANPLGLRRVVTNLVDNAIRYGDNSQIEINLICRTPVCIEVLDRGPGIPDEKKPLVFRPFYRLENSRNPATGGSGLGLAIAMEISRAHGWELVLEDRQGGGTVARLTIPQK